MLLQGMEISQVQIVTLIYRKTSMNSRTDFYPTSLQINNFISLPGPPVIVPNGKWRNRNMTAKCINANSDAFHCRILVY